MRFILEFLKEPQVAFENNLAINMGQWLSIPFIVAGIYIIYRVFKKPFKPWP
jgi:prolipoprotein diacylglyceryltransferase